MGPSGADVRPPDAGPGLPLGEDRPPGGLDAALDVSKLFPPSATVEAWARCGPPAISTTVIPATTTAAATAATPAAARGRRRTSCHQRGPGGLIGFGKPVRPNWPARWVTLTRRARPAGVLSAHAFSIRARRSAGGPAPGITPPGAGLGPPAASPAAAGGPS